MNIYEVDSRTKITVFPSMSDFIEVMDKQAESPSYRGHDSSGWSGGASLREAVDTLKNGWDGGAEVVEDILASLQTSLKQIAKDMTPKVRYDVTGSFPDIELYLEGEPECMVNFLLEDDAKAGQVCRILVDCGASANYTQDWMTRRAGAIAALVQVLQMVGKSIEIWVASPVRRMNGEIVDTVVQVHGAGQTLNIRDVAYGLGHPGMLRKCIFEARADSKMGWNSQDMGGTYGSHHPWTLDYLKPELVIQRAENEPRNTPDPSRDPEAWVRHQLTRLGVLS